MNPLTYVFVYGTLRRGGHNHERYLRAARHVTEARTTPSYTMVSLGGCPGIFDGGRTHVIGEIYAVSAQQLEALDRLEGHPRFYYREPIALETVLGPEVDEVQAYFLPAERYRDRQVIESGNWLSFCRAREYSRKTERAEG